MAVVLLKKLDELLLRDKDTLAYEAYKEFDTFRKVGEMSMVEYINRFDQLYNKAAEYDLTMGTGVLAYLLLKGASLSDNDIKIVRSSLPKLDYSSMKKQLLSVSASCISNSSLNEGLESSGPSLLPPQKKVKTEDFTDEAHWIPPIGVDIMVILPEVASEVTRVEVVILEALEEVDIQAGDEAVVRVEVYVVVQLLIRIQLIMQQVIP